MTSPSVSFVLRASGNLEGSAAMEAAEEYSRFITELGKHLTCPIEMFTQLHEAPASDFILFAGADVRTIVKGYPVEERLAFTKRLIPISVSRTKIFENLLEPLAIPAAIDTLSLVEWERQTTTTRARGLYGLRDIGKAAGASCLLFESKNYCYLQSFAHNGLPHLLADYLRAMRAMRAMDA